MADDERRAEIEAVARAIYGTQENGVPWDSETLGDWRKDYEREKAQAAIEALDRVRDARGDDEPVWVSPLAEAEHDEAARSPQGEDHEGGRDG